MNLLESYDLEFAIKVWIDDVFLDGFSIEQSFFWFLM